MQQPGCGEQEAVVLPADWHTLAGQFLVMGQLLRAAALVAAWGAVPAASTEPAKSSAPALRANNFCFTGEEKNERRQEERPLRTQRPTRDSKVRREQHTGAGSQAKQIPLRHGPGINLVR